MSRELIERLKQQRNLHVRVGTFTFFARRPTDAEMVEIRRSRAGNINIAMDYVHGWDNVIEDDIVGGGGSSVVEFDADLWREWCADRPDFWAPIALAIIDAYKLHGEQLENTEKKSQPG